MSSTAEVAARRRRSRIRWTVRAAIYAILLGLPLGCGLDRLFYHPDSTIYYTPAQLNLRHEDVRFVARDGVRLHGWWLPALTPRPLGTIVHFHGNAANISNHILAAYWLPAAGYHVFMFDYRGYGQSEGSPTRRGTIADGHAALDYVLSRPEVDRERLYFTASHWAARWRWSLQPSDRR